jgi:hypothetical protein
MQILRFLIVPRKLVSWFLIILIGVYLLACAILFFQWVNPSLDGRSDQHIAADSSTYLYMADVLREGRSDPFVLAALSSFPNTLWMPVFLALVLKSTLLMALVNLALFMVSIQLFRRSSYISVGVFLSLILLSPTTTISLLSVNKEIVDFFTMALFCYSRATGRKWVLWFALILSLFNRYEVCLAMFVFLLAQSRFNPWRSRRAITLLILILSLNFSLPLLASHSLANRFAEASDAGVIAFLDSLEMHYLFVLAVIPKIFQNFLGEIPNVSNWAQYNPDDPANSYILVLNNMASLVVVCILAWKRFMRIRYDWVYFAMIGAVFMSVSLVVQPRYFYFCFVLLCFQASHPRTARRGRPVQLIPAGEGIGEI